MKKTEKIRGAQVRALLIYRRIDRLKKDAIGRLTSELNGLLKELTDKKGLDLETLKILNIYINSLGKKDVTVEDRINQIVESFKGELRADKQDGTNTLLLTLSNDGDLYRKPKEEYCYPMKKTGLRMDIIRILIGRKNFIPGKEIADAIGKSYESTTFAINKINEIAQRQLNLPEKQGLIISKPRGGYKLNPLYPITQEQL